MKKLQSLILLKYSSNVPVGPKMRENQAYECFYHYNEVLLFLHILQLKLGMLVIILRNLEPLIKYNGTKAWITHIGHHTIKAEVIGGSKAHTQIVIFCIYLQSKDNESKMGQKTAVPYQFTRQYYPICFIFAIIINKSQC